MHPGGATVALRCWLERACHVSEGTLAAPTLVLIGMLAVGCDSEVPAELEPSRPASIAISPDSAGFSSLGETLAFTASVTDQYGWAFEATVAWSSSDPSVFTVDANGAVTAAENGTGALTASFQSLSATAVVTVKQVAALIEAVSVNSGNGPPLTSPRAVAVSPGVRPYSADWGRTSL